MEATREYAIMVLWWVSLMAAGTRLLGEDGGDGRYAGKL